MKAKELGERNFLSKIKHLVGEVEGAVLGFDEDASDIPIDETHSIVINVDTFVKSTDWLPGMSDAQVGRKTAVMALSDIVAKGATPVTTMLSLCIPKDFDASSAEEIVRGFSQYCLKNNIPFIGGDLAMGDDVVLTGVAIGRASSKSILLRGGASEGDIVAVTGDFGLTSVAFQFLLNEKDVESELRSDALAAAYKPEIHIGFVDALFEAGAVSASMDSSDGLGITLNTIAEQSKMGMIIDVLPASPKVAEFAKHHNLEFLDLVLQGGEEFILVLTIPEEKWDTALAVAEHRKIPLKKIGYTTNQRKVVYESSTGTKEISARGYDNFTEWE
jgi:thiamine-monophosphate kinase